MKKVFSVHSGLGAVHLLYSGIHNFEKKNFFLFVLNLDFDLFVKFTWIYMN